LIEAIGMENLNSRKERTVQFEVKVRNSKEESPRSVAKVKVL